MTNFEIPALPDRLTRVAAAGRCLLVCLMMSGATVSAQTNSPILMPGFSRAKVEKPVEEPKQIDEAAMRQDLRDQLNMVQQAIDKQRAESPGAAVSERLTQQLELLKYLDGLYANRKANRGRKAILQEELNRVQQHTESLSALATDDGKPCSFLEFDGLRDQLYAEQSRQDSIQLEVDAGQASLDASRKLHEDGEAKRRLAREQLDSGEASHASNRDYEIAKLRSRVFGEAVRQRKLELEVNQLELKLSQSRAAFLREKVSQMRSTTHFSQLELDEKIAYVDKAEADYRSKLAEAVERMAELERECLEANQTLEQASEASEILTETAVMWTLLNELNQEHISLLQRVLGYAGVIRTVWRQRYDLANQQSEMEELTQWRQQLDVVYAEVIRFQKLIEIRADERMGDLATLRKRLAGVADSDSRMQQLISQQEHELEQVVFDYASQLVLIKTAERLFSRFGEELDQAIEPGTARQQLALARQALNALWNYEITSVDDRAVTVSKVVWGTLLIIVGLCFARLFSRLLGRRILPKLGMNQGAAVAFQSIAFYLLLTCFGFVALEVINLPLTVFAFMGGAIAIGVGFGSQNVLNNFISGLILLAERPVRAGDLVDIDGLNGTIEHIGARSTRVKTGSNLEIIVPNSKFLENNVTNWTLSDTRIRSVVRVGVAYGSPVHKVRQLLHEAVINHKGILQEPEPIVLFKDFGDNSLMFEAHYWIHMRTVMQSERIASDLRLALDRMFADENITIAYPQRDVHLDTLAPIEVNVRQFVEDLAVGPRGQAA